MGKSALVSVLVVAIIGFVIFSQYIGYSNYEKRLRNQIKAEQDVCKISHDKMWKIISGKAGVATEYKDSFNSVFTDIMNARYDSKKAVGTLMSWVHEHNPEFDSSLYKDVQQAIEAQRTVYANAQEKLRDLKREHDNLLDIWPGSIFLSFRDKIDITIVTSSQTERVYKTGKDDMPANPFEKAKPENE